MTPASARTRPGFTLIEVMAVVFLTALVLGVALNYYSDLSNASQRAMDQTREVRRAAAILDRIAKDLQSATLMTKPSEADRLSHPWIFLGESRGYAEKGSDRIKFVTRSYQPRRQSKNRHESDRAIVTYSFDEDEEENLLLRRGVSTHWPEGLDRDFPFPEEMLLLTDELNSFSLTFLDETGAWLDIWDSSQLVQADQLPLAVKIEVVLAESLASANEPSGDPAGFDDLAGTSFSRTVVLPQRPLDLALLTDPNGAYAGLDNATGESSEGEEDSSESDSDEESCKTVLECFDVEAAQADVDSGGSLGPANIANYLNNMNVASSCFDDYRSSISAEFIRPACR